MNDLIESPKYTWQVINDSAIDGIGRIQDNSIDCIVTSPPYYKKRDYGVIGQIGQEKTTEDFLKSLSGVFNTVYSKLKDGATVYINIGDTYSDGKPLCIPWKLVDRIDKLTFRQSIIWHKPNAQPRSYTKRYGEDHEYILFFTKGENWYFDRESVKVKAKQNRWGGKKPGKRENSKDTQNVFSGLTRERDMMPEWTLRRSVWSIPTEPYTGSHFATMPRELAKTCILSGCPVGGTVLDPFAGTGTTGMVSIVNSRNVIMIEINKNTIENNLLPRMRQAEAQPLLFTWDYK